MKKKLMALVLLCTMAAAMTACGGKEKDDSANDRVEKQKMPGSLLRRKMHQSLM